MSIREKNNHWRQIMILIITYVYRESIFRYILIFQSFFSNYWLLKITFNMQNTFLVLNVISDGK